MTGAPRTRMAEKRRKIARRHQRIKLLFLSVFIAAASLIFYAGFNFNDLNFDGSSINQAKHTQILKNKSDEKMAVLPKSDKRLNIMIMGVDEREVNAGRSDTLMIASLDSKHDTVSLLSIPRDTRVKIKKHGYDKINAAYAYGGEKLSKSTVESFLGINVDHYVMVNTKSFVNMIDAIGGIDINVEDRMEYEDPWDDDGGLVIDLKPGMQHMDGKTAITYVRYRDAEGDAGRVRRQQKFMRACLDKLTSPSIIAKLPDIIQEASKAVKTDLSIGQMIQIAGTLKNADDSKEGLKTGIVPGSWLYINGVSYLVPDIERLGKVLTVNLGFNGGKMKEHFEKIAYEYSDSVPFYYDKHYFEYDENVDMERDRQLIERLFERHVEINENNV